MTTIVLPLWGWVLVALAALILLAYVERDRVGEHVSTLGRSMRRDRSANRLQGGWDCAVMRAEPRLQKLFVQLISRIKAFPHLLGLILTAYGHSICRRFKAFLGRVWLTLTAPWRWLCAQIAECRLRKLGGHPPLEKPWAVIDYSAKRAVAIERLGDDYVLKRPVKRRDATGLREQRA